MENIIFLSNLMCLVVISCTFLSGHFDKSIDTPTSIGDDARNNYCCGVFFFYWVIITYNLIELQVNHMKLGIVTQICDFFLLKYKIVKKNILFSRFYMNDRQKNALKKSNKLHLWHRKSETCYSENGTHFTILRSS